MQYIIFNSEDEQKIKNALTVEMRNILWRYSMKAADVDEKYKPMIELTKESIPLIIRQLENLKIINSSEDCVSIESMLECKLNNTDESLIICFNQLLPLKGRYRYEVGYDYLLEYLETHFFKENLVDPEEMFLKYLSGFKNHTSTAEVVKEIIDYYIINVNPFECIKSSELAKFYEECMNINIAFGGDKNHVPVICGLTDSESIDVVRTSLIDTPSNPQQQTKSEQFLLNWLEKIGIENIFDKFETWEME